MHCGELAHNGIFDVPTEPPMPTLGAIAFLVHDYDDAIAFFTKALRFDLVEDTPQGDGKRWVTVAPRGSQGTRLLLARAINDEQRAHVGKQGGGRVFLFLETDDFASDHAHMLAHGVRFREEPRHEVYGSVVVFEDLYGNGWDLIQPKR
jgi:catechol 2,3-dioxygenase-like lactoylglutathione lyase family enzyme